MSKINNIFIIPIRGYQKFISPLLGHHCRYIPSCSQYAIEAIQLHGVVRGGFLAFKRILRCNPFGGHGFDYVPEKSTRKKYKK